MGIWLHSLGLSIQYFTRIPLPLKLRYDDETIKRSLFFLPLIGWLIGLIYYYVYQILNYFIPSSVLAVLLVAFLLWISGGLHADGWMDVWDGIGSSRDKEKMLTIMHDSRVGSFGVIGFVILFALKTTSLGELMDSIYAIEAFILTPMLARWGVLLAVFTFPYARENGLGKKFKEWFRLRHLLLSFLWLIPIVWLSPRFLLLLSVTVIFILFAGYYFKKKLDGLTGDIYGFLIEGTEALIWLVLILVAR